MAADARRPLPALKAADAARWIERAGIASEIVIVGGQALNAWAEHYLSADPELSDLGPFTTPDIDVIGRERVADACARRLNASIDHPPPDQLNTPEIAVVRVNPGTDDELEIDFLGSIVGGSTANVEETAIPLAISPTLTVRVMHPVLLLETRLANSAGVLRRTDRYSLHRLRAAALVCRAHIASVASDNARAALNMIERVAKIAASDGACRLWLDHQVDIAVALRDYPGLPDDYRTIRLPQLREHLARERSELARIRAERLARLAARQP